MQQLWGAFGNGTTQSDLDIWNSCKNDMFVKQANEVKLAQTNNTCYHIV